MGGKETGEGGGGRETGKETGEGGLIEGNGSGQVKWIEQAVSIAEGNPRASDLPILLTPQAS